MVTERSGGASDRALVRPCSAGTNRRMQTAPTHQGELPRLHHLASSGTWIRTQSRSTGSSRWSPSEDTFSPVSAWLATSSALSLTAVVHGLADADPCCCKRHRQLSGDAWVRRHGARAPIRSRRGESEVPFGGPTRRAPVIPRDQGPSNTLRCRARRSAGTPPQSNREWGPQMSPTRLR